MNYTVPMQTNKTFNQIDLKKINQKKVFEYVYREYKTSKQEIANALDLSLPTVSSSINFFIDQNLMQSCGEYKSTGGRRAKVFCCNTLARIAFGVEILKERVRIVATDIYGKILNEEFLEVMFSNTQSYYEALGTWINNFVDGLGHSPESYLGVCIAIQGLVSLDGERISYSEILKSTDVGRDVYQQYIQLPCTLIHDTEAAALAESWLRSDVGNAVYIALNRNFGGVVLINGRVQKDSTLNSGVIEHLCLDPGGGLCYCGKRGCVETFCSANSLREQAQMNLSEFFDKVHSGDSKCLHIWRRYLEHLALAIDNIRMIVDCQLIIGGYLLQFMNQSDIDLLTTYIENTCAFSTPPYTVQTSTFGDKSPLIGAALSLIEDFIISF